MTRRTAWSGNPIQGDIMSTAAAGKSSSSGVADDDGSGPVGSGDEAGSQPAATSVRNSSRLYYLDWIRVLSLLFVFLFHTFVGDGASIAEFVGLSSIGPIITGFGIAVFFVVSGAASMFSLERRTSGLFLRERILRLGVPFLVGAAVLVPLSQYVSPIYLSNTYPDFQGSLWDYYGIFFTQNIESLSWQTSVFTVFGGWLWVLGFLFVYSVVGLPALQWLRSASADRFISFTTRLASFRGGVIVWVVLAVAFAVVGEAVLLVFGIQSVDFTSGLVTFGDGWGGLLRLFGLFLLGAVLVRNREVLRFVRRDWPVAFLIMVAAALLTMWASSHPSETAAFWIGLQAMVTVGSWCLVLVILAAGQRWLNRPGRLLAYSLGIIVAFYVLHLPVIAAVERALANQSWASSLYQQAAPFLGLIVLVVSFVALIALIELVVRPIPPLRKFLGVTKKRIPGQYNHKVTDHDQRAVDQDESANRPPERELPSSGDNTTQI